MGGLSMVAPAGLGSATALPGRAPRAGVRPSRLSVRVMAAKEEQHQQQGPSRVAHSLLAAAMAASMGLGMAGPVMASDEGLSPYQKRQLAAERRKELLRAAREKAEASAESTSETGADAAAEFNNPAEPEAPVAPKLDASDLKARLQYPEATKATEQPKAEADVPAEETPKPAAPAFKFGGFSRPAATEEAKEEAAPAEDAKEEEEPAPSDEAPKPAAPAFKFNYTKPAAPTPAPKAPEPEAKPVEDAGSSLGVDFGSYLKSSTPAPAPVAPPPPPPKPVVKPPPPPPAPIVKETPKASSSPEDMFEKYSSGKPAFKAEKEAEKQVAKPAAKPDKKAGKRKGPLPLFLAQLLVLGAFGGFALAVTRFSGEVGKATETASKFFSDSLTKIENTLKK